MKTTLCCLLLVLALTSSMAMAQKTNNVPFLASYLNMTSRTAVEGLVYPGTGAIEVQLQLGAVGWIFDHDGCVDASTKTLFANYLVDTASMGELLSIKRNESTRELYIAGRIPSRYCWATHAAEGMVYQLCEDPYNNDTSQVVQVDPSTGKEAMLYDLPFALYPTGKSAFDQKHLILYFDLGPALFKFDIKANKLTKLGEINPPQILYNFQVAPNGDLYGVARTLTNADIYRSESVGSTKDTQPPQDGAFPAAYLAKISTTNAKLTRVGSDSLPALLQYVGPDSFLQTKTGHFIGQFEYDLKTPTKVVSIEISTGAVAELVDLPAGVMLVDMIEDLL